MGEHSPHTSPRIQALRRLPIRERVAALSSALRLASSDEAPELAAELLELASESEAPTSLHRLLASPRPERTTDVALGVLVSNWSKLDESTKRAAVAVGMGRWTRISDIMASEGSPTDRENLAELILDAPDPSLAPAAAAMLGAPEASVGRLAERAVVRLALAALPEQDRALLGRELAELAGRPRVDQAAIELGRDAGAEILLRAIADAAWSFAEHRRPAPLVAALLLLDQPLVLDSDEAVEDARASMCRLHRLLDESSHPSHSAAGKALKRRTGPIFRQRAWRLMTSPGLVAAAVERVARAESIEEHRAVLAESHLAINPRRARACLHLEIRPRRKATPTGERITLDETGPIPVESQLGRLTPDERQGAIRLLGSMRADHALARAARAPFLDDPDPGVRLAAASAADAIELGDYCYDADPRVARSATIRWSVVGDPGGVRWPPRLREAARARTASLLARSPHAPVRRLARHDLERLSPFNPASPSGRLAARRWRRDDPESFRAELAARLSMPGERERIDALRTIIATRAAGECLALAIDRFEDQCESDRVRATAVGVLAESCDPEAVETVARAMTDRDDRVRANAVEARARQTRAGADLAVREPEFHERLIELKDDPRHRVRANALRVLLASGTPDRRRVFEPTAVEGLDAMLTDTREAHRVAGAWLAEHAMCGAGRERLGESWRELAKRVSRMAAEDACASARRRATRCAARLVGEIRVLSPDNPRPVPAEVAP